MRQLATALVLLLCSNQLFADSPEYIVSAYFQKVKKDGFTSISELMHPDELRKMHEMMLPIIAESLMSEDAPTFKGFADKSDPKTVAKMTDAEFMNRFMTWVSDLQPALRQIISGATIETLGHVVEGDLKHVVVRMKMNSNGIDIEKMSVMTVKDFEGKPRMTLSGEMKGVAESLKRQKATK
jgi:hypothetical protein